MWGVFSTVTKDIVKQELPSDFLNALKKFGKTDDEILEYFKDYHNLRSGESWLNDIQLLKTQYTNLNDDEIFSIWGYTTNFFYYDLNSCLRAGINSSLTSEFRLIMNNAISKLPIFLVSLFIEESPLIKFKLITLLLLMLKELQTKYGMILLLVVVQ